MLAAEERVREERPATTVQRQCVLFLCTGNSCRSQMAESFLQNLFGNRFEAYSAGTSPAECVHPWAVRAMREIGIDISGQRAKSFSDLPVKSFDIVITVCDNALQRCAVFPAADRKVHWSIPDPAGTGGTQREIESAFRQVRDMIREKLMAEFGRP